MTETPTVSVIIPCLNGEATLGEAIESALNQTVPPLEVLVVDDGSSDRSIAVAAACGPKVRILQNDVGGPGAARQIGVNQARGTYIAFVDADDLLDPAKHERQLAVLASADRHTVVHTAATVFWTDGRQAPLYRGGGEQATGRCLRAIFERNPVCGASCMLRRDLVLELGNYEPALFGTEDLGMSLLAATCCDFVYLPEPLYLIRRHEGNLTNRACHMAYVHWLAQEQFRCKRPSEFASLPAESVRQFMIEPVIRAAKEAHWRREGRDSTRLLRLAVQLAPGDRELRRMWHKRFIPTSWLRAWDRLTVAPRRAVTEVS